MTLAEWLVGDGRTVERIDLIQARWVSVQSGRIVASLSYRNQRNGGTDAIAQQITAGLRQRTTPPPQ
jgi:hypothetical protein